MATKLIVLCLVLSAFQFTNALEERSFINDIANNVISQLQSVANGIIIPIEQRIEKGISNVGNLIRNATTKMEQVIMNVVGSASNLSNAFVSNVEAEAQKAVQLGKNVTSCSVQALQKAADIVSTASTNVRNCTNTALQPAKDLENDLVDLAKMAAQFTLGIPGQVINCLSSGFLGVLPCEVKLTADLTAKGTMLGSAVASDVLKFGGLAVSIPVSIGKCEAEGLAYDTTQFTALGLTTFNCFANGPSA